MAQVSSNLQELLRIVKRTAESMVRSRMEVEDSDKAELYQQITKLKAQLNVKRYFKIRV